MLAMFDRKNMLLDDMVLSVGTSNASMISPPEIFRAALLKHAEFVILLHNHPSGNPEPSKEDINVTFRIRTAENYWGSRSWIILSSVTIVFSVSVSRTF